MPSTQRSLQLSHVTMAYREWGKGRPIILLHGMADHGLMWQPLGEAWQDCARCLAPDLRGHGDSDKPTDIDAYDANAIAADLEALCDDLGLATVAVIAHSWAAKVALLWAQRHPNRLQKLVLVDPFFVNRFPSIARMTFPLLYRTLPFLKVMGPFASEADAVTCAQTLKQYRDWTPHQRQAFAAGLEQKSDGSWGSKFTCAARDGIFADTVQTAGLTQIAGVSTLMVLPKQGLNQTPWQLRPYRTYLPQLQEVSVPGNHWPHLVAPADLVTAIAPFLFAS